MVNWHSPLTITLSHPVSCTLFPGDSGGNLVRSVGVSVDMPRPPDHPGFWAWWKQCKTSSEGGGVVPLKQYIRDPTVVKISGLMLILVDYECI